MGTRSTTRINDSGGEHLVTLYRQFDGYPTGHGQELADFLKARTLINGFSDQSAETHANGMGCLSAQLIKHFKTGIGGIYITREGDSQEYNYTVYEKDGNLCMLVESPYADKPLFDGLASAFDGVEVAKEDDEDEEDN